MPSEPHPDLLAAALADREAHPENYYKPLSSVPSEYTRELVAALVHASGREDFLNRRAALLSHYAEIEQRLATALGDARHCSTCDRPGVCDIIRRGTGPCGRNAGIIGSACDIMNSTHEKLATANERIAKMQAVSIQFRSEIEGGYAALAAIKDSDIVKRSRSLRTFEKWCAALDALPSPHRGRHR